VDFNRAPQAVECSDSFIIGECSKLEEAIAIANYYRSIVNSIQNQISWQ
jgi:hypothetical protein